MLASQCDTEQWRLEVERVAPRLKVTVRVDGKEWRTHLDLIHHHRARLQACLPALHSGLGRHNSAVAGLVLVQ